MDLEGITKDAEFIEDAMIRLQAKLTLAELQYMHGSSDREAVRRAVADIHTAEVFFHGAVPVVLEQLEGAPDTPGRQGE